MKKGLQGKSVKIDAKAGDNGKLFGSITTAQVAKALSHQKPVAHQAGTDVEPRNGKKKTTDRKSVV